MKYFHCGYGHGAWILLALSVGCCPAHRRMSPAMSESLAGVASTTESSLGGIVSDPAAEQRMIRVTKRLSTGFRLWGLKHHCRILASDRPNALSLPDGRLYVTRGLYDQLSNDSQLACVLSHELAHIARGDHYKPQCTTNEETLRRELATDALAVVYLSKAGFDRKEMPRIIDITRSVQKPALVAARVERLRQTIR